MTRNGIPEVLVRSVTSLYEGAMKRVRVDCSEKFSLKCGCTKDLCCHLFLMQLW